MAYHLHDVKITGIDLAQVLDCRIEGRIGEHGSLTVYGYPAGTEDALYEVPSYQRIEVYLDGENGKQVLFCGVVTDISYTVSGGMRMLKAEAKSSSYLMDLTKRSRSFQDTGQSYPSLIAGVMDEYPDSSLSYAAPDVAAGRLIVQYEETDWEFLKRVMSSLGLTVTPDSRLEGIKLYAGIPALSEREVPYRLLKIEKDLDSFYSLKSWGYQVHDTAFTKYEILSEQPLGLFEQIKLGGHFFTVYSFRYEFRDQELAGSYGLQLPQGLLRPGIYPMQLIGAALNGKVTGVSGDKIQAVLSIDQDRDSPAVYWFPYSTISASPDGSGWYCMPECGDEVRIYFPSKHEKDAVALSSASDYSCPKGGERDRMQDPNVRYLRTKHGQELALTPKFLKLSCGDGLSSVVIKDDGKISIHARDAVVIDGPEGVTVHGDEKICMHSRDVIDLQSLDGANVKIGSGNIGFYGTEVKFE